MKKLTVFALLLVLCLCLCACGESEKPDEIADIPNIDHNILDADRHLGNSYENYSSEDTLLVEYGNRIYHAYNSRHEIKEYCTANDKEKSLGIYGTNLSVYKNVLYYIAEDELSIHAFDLATSIDSVWITGEEILNKIPKSQHPTHYFSPQIGNLLISDYGFSLMLGHIYGYFIHVDFNNNLIMSHYLGYGVSADNCSVVPISNTNVIITDMSLSYILSFDLKSLELNQKSTEHMIYKTLSTSNGRLYVVTADDRLLFELSSNLCEYKPITLPQGNLSNLRAVAIHNDRVIYGFVDSLYYDCSHYFQLGEADYALAMPDVELFNITFTSNGLIFAITNDSSELDYNDSQIKKYIMANYDFTTTRILDEKYETFALN
ncbi:MAG: hypothetical protein IJF14_03720 [Clostridia bacterium]|nr:hypothetical protein [Clostridia bacterium]